MAFPASEDITPESGKFCRGTPLNEAAANAGIHRLSERTAETVTGIFVRELLY
jgi:hypothetical protein